MKIENLEKVNEIYRDFKELEGTLEHLKKDNRIGIGIYDKADKSYGCHLIVFSEYYYNDKDAAESFEARIWDKISLPIISAINDEMMACRQELYKLGIENF